MWSIIKSHFHKGKTGFIITGLFIALSVIMLIVGLSICLGMNGLYYNVRNLSNSADCFIGVYESPGGESQALIENILNERDDVDIYDIQDYYYLESSTGEDNNNRLSIFNSKGQSAVYNSWVALDVDDEGNAFAPYLRDTVEKEGYKFYVTGNCIETSPINVGDEVVYVHDGVRYEGYVAGIYDDTTRIYHTANIYISGDLFDEIARMSQNDENVTKEYYVNIRFDYEDEKENALARQQLQDRLIEALTEYNACRLAQDPTAPILYYTYWTREDFKTGTQGFILLLGTAMVAFAIIVAIIVAIVITFLVRSSVLDEVRNLGVFKSLGYTTDQLRASYLAIYGVISGICLLAGTVLGIVLMPTFVDIITSMARLDCSKAIGVNVGAIFIAIIILIAIVASVVYLSTAKVKRITPLSAMRSNIQTHSFKKNKAPLEKSRISLNAHLGIKSVVGETHRSVMVVAIVLIMSLLCSFVSVVYYNLKVDQTAIINMSALENADYYIAFYYEDPSPYFDAIHEMDGFEADVMHTRVGMSIDDDFSYGQLFSSFEHMRTNFLSRGRYPKYSNEILIEEQYAKSRGLYVGDSVTMTLEIDLQKSERSCVIVGYFQNLIDTTRFMGFTDIMDELSHLEDFAYYSQHLIYFDPDKAPTIDELDEVLSQVAGGNVKYNGFQSGRDLLENSFLNTVETASDAVMSVFFTITALVIALLLVMLIKLKLLRERRNYAIYKALGYATGDIMTQIAIAMVILGLIGSAVGAIVGALTTSPILSLVGNFIGAGSFSFAIPWGYTVAIIVAIPILIYAISMLCAIPVRRIEPAQLLRER